MNIAARSAYIDQPMEVSLETLALCNARCTFCPYPTLERKGTKMSDALIARLIVEMSRFEHPFFFSPFKVNEPFLDARLPHICERFEEWCPKGRLRLFTNGSVLTDYNVYWVSRLERVEHLWISLNSTDPDEYEIIMGLNYEKTARKLDRLHDESVVYALTAKQWTIPVVLSKVADDDGEKNLRFWRDCQARWPRFRPCIIKRDGWLGYVSPANAFIPDQPCSRWYELSILATGKVALCCMDGTGEFAIGDCVQQSLLEIYNAPSYRERRLGIVSRKRYEPCQRCTY